MEEIKENTKGGVDLSKEYKMFNKKNLIILIFAGFFIASIFFVSSIETSYCCEKTKSNAWCQNTKQENCDANYQKAPTSCESTSYCRLGTCYDSQEGTCMENSPERVCNEEGGIWAEGKPDEIPQCKLGCCLIGDQAAFVTQTRCKKLSALYGLEINFRTDINNEIECIASATSEVKGACVFEKEFEKTCQFVTKKECSEMKSTTATTTETGGFLGLFSSKKNITTSISAETNFHEGYLCSSDELGANCGPTEQTACVEGKDEVYFKDSCGNIANIYDSSKINDKGYWNKVIGKTESCNSGKSNANSQTCGNCDYFLGSTCKAYKSSKDKKRPTYGDNICRDLSCEYEGKTYQHGETWCADSKGVKNNFPGSRYFRLVCYNSEVLVEPCADFRQETCIQDEINGFKTAACRVNKWQDCSSQTEKQDCENEDRRNCKWVEGDKIKCAPKFAPGFDFWNSEGDSQSICSSASATCTVKYEKGLAGGKKCVENCECIGQGWKDKQNQVCLSLGDCGSKTNFLGIQGYS